MDKSKVIAKIMAEFYEPFSDGCIPPVIIRGMLELAWECGQTDLTKEVKHHIAMLGKLRNSG